MAVYTDIMQDASEIVHYNQPGIPLYIYSSFLSSYHEMRALCHWHDDIELICIQEGKMHYSVNGRQLLLKTGDCLVVNSRQMHYGFDYRRRECRFICILFHPSLLRSNQVLYQNYVLPVIENPAFEYLYLASPDDSALKAMQLLEQILSANDQAQPFYELNILSLLMQFWCFLLQQPGILPQKNAAAPNSDLDLQRNIVTFIYQNYAEKLTLDEIAAAGNVGRNKCCALFRKYLQQSPIDFLNRYRLEVSCNLLQNSSKSITEIALACGFVHLSYFSKLFQRSYGCTPSEYRRLKP